mmetsp:Transcript_30814/g.71979  ORF Transcript_30814/g.71979 Transcript_30814/m.71979 type:complete len:407 (-) Transcript_30814:92-1312(-)
MNPFEDDDELFEVFIRADQNAANLAAGTGMEVWGLVLVAAWPPEDMREPYERLVEGFKSLPSMSSAYIYPFGSLHVSIVTAHAFTRSPPVNDTLKAATLEEWADMVASARRSGDWPRRPLRLRCVTAELHEAAGVLRYDDVEGTVAAMRQCIQREVDLRHRGLQKRGIDVRVAHIPNIIHSTILRWTKVPTEPGHKVREDFIKVTEEALGEGVDVIDDELKLVVETRPYMHVEQSAAKFCWELGYGAVDSSQDHLSAPLGDAPSMSGTTSSSSLLTPAGQFSRADPNSPSSGSVQGRATPTSGSDFHRAFQESAPTMQDGGGRARRASGYSEPAGFSSSLGALGSSPDNRCWGQEHEAQSEDGTGPLAGTKVRGWSPSRFAGSFSKSLSKLMGSSKTLPTHSEKRT